MKSTHHSSSIGPLPLSHFSHAPIELSEITFRLDGLNPAFFSSRGPQSKPALLCLLFFPWTFFTLTVLLRLLTVYGSFPAWPLYTLAFLSRMPPVALWYRSVFQMISYLSFRSYQQAPSEDSFLALVTGCHSLYYRSSEPLTA